MDFVTDVEEVTAEWLAERLRSRGYLDRGSVVSFDVVDRPHPHRTVYRLKVTYFVEASFSAPRNLIFKVNKKPAGHALREGPFYTEFVSKMENPPVPICYDVQVDWDARQAVFLFEDISSTHHTHSFPIAFAGVKAGEKWWTENWANYTSNYHPDRTAFEDILDAYLAFHTHWWEHPLLQSEQIQKPVHSILSMAEAVSEANVREGCRKILENDLPEFVDAQGDAISKDWWRICERVFDVWPDLFVPRVADGKGVTLIQADSHLLNVLLPRDPTQHQPMLIDWEVYRPGLGVWDLSYLLHACMVPRERRRELEPILLQHYCDALAKQSIDYSLDQAFEDYRLCVLGFFAFAVVAQSIHYLELVMHAFEDWDCEGLLA